jgi:hypothetical protein
VRVLNPEKSMRKSEIRSVRPRAGGVHFVVCGLSLAGCLFTGCLLTGCAVLESWVGPPSLKDGVQSEGEASTAQATQPTKASIDVSRRSPPAPSSKGTGCVDQDCLDRLKALLEDRERKWIGQPQSPKEHANGTRQFAYRALRASLTCNELALAIEEIARAMRAFLAPVAGVSADQVTRVRSLDAEVQYELRAEYTGRCGT